MTTQLESGGTLRLHIGAIYCGEEVRLVTAGTSPAALAESLSKHVRKNARHQLFPADARRVYRLLANKKFTHAVELYFASVGTRWDNERLFVSVVDV